MRARFRDALVTTLAAVLLTVSLVGAQTSEETQAIIREAAERHGVSGDWLVRVARCESRFEVYAVGRAGEVGIFQLHPRGLLPMFYTRGGTDHWNIAQQAEFTAWAFARGLAHHWTCR